MLTLDEKKRRLIEALQLLRATPEDQLKIFSDFVNKADEMALLFDDCYVFIDELLDCKKIKESQAVAIKAVNDVLTQMSDIKAGDLWTCNAVRNDKKWTEVRSLATKALDFLDVKYRLPNIDWLSFV